MGMRGDRALSDSTAMSTMGRRPRAARAGRASHVALASALAAGLMGASPAAAQRADDPTLRAEQAAVLDRASLARSAESEKLIEEANALAVEIAALREELVAAGLARARQERATAAARARLEMLAAQELSLAQELMDQRAALEQILGALQRTARSKPPALAARPSDAADAARAALLLSEAAPNLEARASELKAEIDALRGLRASVADARLLLEDAEAALETQRQAVRGLIGRKQGLEAGLRGDAARERRQAADLAREAQSIRDVIQTLSARDARVSPRLKPAAPVIAPPPAIAAPAPRGEMSRPQTVPLARPAGATRFSAAHGRVRPPAVGRLVRGYGVAGPNGMDAGVTLATARSAQITAPFAGVVAYADPLLDHRRLLILDVGDGYYIVMAGMNDVHVRVGDAVVAGEPIGEMPARRSSELYMEIRRRAEPVDPTPWLGGDWT